MRGPAGATRSRVIAAVTTAIARRSDDTEGQEHRHQAGAALAAVEAEADAVSPGRAGVGGQCAARLWCLTTAGEVVCLPRGELDCARDQDDHAGRDRNGARQRRPLHCGRCQRDTDRERGDSEPGPHGVVPRGYHCGQPPEARLGCVADGLTVAPQHRHQRGLHHRDHHRDPHAEEGCRGAGPRLPGHPHPRHRHRPATGHRHVAHRRHGGGPDDRQGRAGREDQRRDGDERTRGISHGGHADALSASRTRRGAATRRRARCARAAHGRATGTWPRWCPGRVHRRNKRGRRFRPPARMCSCPAARAYR